MADSKTPAPKLKNDAEIDTTLVRSLADILNDTDLTEIEVERGELRIRVAREITMAAPVQYAAAPAAAAHAPAPAPS
ncbi:MAG: acetyl-CoA carboxylase, biotin carboxyl carrier protein, partial [Brevundimonas sp.]